MGAMRYKVKQTNLNKLKNYIKTKSQKEAERFYRDIIKNKNK
jgi:hypothetical protein